MSHRAFEADPIIAMLRRQRAEGVWNYAMLSDARGVTGNPTVDEVARFRSEEAQCGPDGERPGPLLIIATDADLFRRACAYAILAGTHRPIHVVRERADAEAWLREQGF